jgi:hypothetical protein
MMFLNCEWPAMGGVRKCGLEFEDRLLQARMA